MNSPALYHKYNDVQRHDSERIIKRFATTIQWRYDGQDSLIDVGSGSGDVLMDFIHPMMPTNFQRIVCSDYNPNMVNYARSQYGHIPRSEFKVLDIGTENKLSPDLKGQFDHLMSFYTLMWVPNQRQSLQNIYDLLRPHAGDCLLVFLASHPIFHAFKCLSEQPKWSKYMTDVDTLRPPLQYSTDPAMEYADILADVGFSSNNVEMQNKIFEYDSMEVCKANMTAVNPFMNRIPLSLQHEHMDDLMSVMHQSSAIKYNAFNEASKYPISYRLMVVYARKCP